MGKLHSSRQMSTCPILRRPTIDVRASSPSPTHHHRSFSTHGRLARRGEARRGEEGEANRRVVLSSQPKESVYLSLSSISLIVLFCHFLFLHCISLLRIVSWFFFCLPILCNEAVGVVVSRVCGFYKFEKLRECFFDVVVLFSSRTGSGSAFT